ncbi:response regulator transcription factor [Cryobacterium sp. Hh38]|uniref:response regulator transcription factor n=1 Tax=Cryobacterium sp. Hh38 TaxID=1259156 RepID=UPI00106A5733|nr:response regulator transcription factor [Cryobacterium sp. Hh38]TFD60482.1 response regulator transcription factor [Cryobacterium sp. Hh38]
MVLDNADRRVAVIIEDDADIRNLLEEVLTQAGFKAIPTCNGLDGIAAVRAHDPIVTTLDVSMPGIDGFETARRIRAFSPTYLVMLTARDDEIDTLQGLDAGADDYLTKPFRPRELRARIEAMLRRPRQPVTTDAVGPAAETAPAPSELVAAGEALAEASVLPGQPDPTEETGTVDGWYGHNGLRLNPAERLVQLGDAQLDLTRTEFDLLGALLESQRKVRSKNDLAVLLRGEANASAYPVNEADRRAIEVHMGNLRRKLGDSSTTPRWLETVRGVGYRLASAQTSDLPQQ